MSRAKRRAVNAVEVVGLRVRCSNVQAGTDLLINEVEDCPRHNATAENLAACIWGCLKEYLPGLEEVQTAETPTSCVTYQGEGLNETPT